MSITAVATNAAARRFTTAGMGEVTIAVPDLVVRPGELVAVTGPTASGKTTLVNLLAGWDRPDAGAVTWTGASDTPPPWTELTVIPQHFALIDELDVLENITLPARGGATIADADLDAVIHVLGLDALRSRSVEEISVGERQRVMVARALVGRPAVVLADEPVAHQDLRNADAILRLLLDRAASGAACVVATREADIAARAHRRIDLSGRFA